MRVINDPAMDETAAHRHSEEGRLLEENKPIARRLPGRDRRVLRPCE
jgi:hypothetical protein